MVVDESGGALVYMIVEISPRILALSLHQEHTCNHKPRQERTALDEGIKMATHME